MFHSSYATARRFCLALILLASAALALPSGQPTAATVSYPAASVNDPAAGSAVSH
jgi:hypothetical protein